MAAERCPRGGAEMRIRSLLLATSAVVGGGPIDVARSAWAGEPMVLAGGALNLTIDGLTYVRAHGGDLDRARLDRSYGRDLDFSTDFEVHIHADGQDERTGLDYGVTIEIEADTSNSDNADETWIYVSGGFGEVRLGDEDGVLDNSLVGAQTIAAGTGGIDGSVIDTIATGIIKPANTDDATKIRYYTPSFGGLQLAVSYTPNQNTVNSGAGNGDTLASKGGGGGAGDQAKNIVEGGVIYTGDFAGFGVNASLVGLYGKLTNQGQAAFSSPGGNNDNWYGYLAGADVDVFGFKLAGSYWQDRVGETKKKGFTAGVGAALGPATVSVTYAQLISSDNIVVNGNTLDKPSNLVFSATVGLMPGLTLDGDVGLFNNDVKGNTVNADGDNGYQAVARLGVAF